jgi:hypothetical protein
MLDPVFGSLITVSFAILFAGAAVHKWRNLASFEAVFAAYGLLPAAMGERLYWLVPVLESAVVPGLLAAGTRTGAAVLGVLLLVSYAAAILLNLQRGRRDIACGCGGPDQRRPIAAWMVGRNGLLALLLAGTLWPWSTRALTWTDRATIAFGVAAACVAYLCFDRLGLVAQRARALQGSP